MKKKIKKEKPKQISNICFFAKNNNETKNDRCRYAAIVKVMVPNCSVIDILVNKQRNISKINSAVLINIVLKERNY